MPKFELHAWVDESITTRTADRPGMYVLAAVVADPRACDGVRDRFRSLTLRRGGRLHWHHEDSKGRDRIARAIADVDVAAIVVVGSPIDNSRQERARRCCLERLLFELDALDVSHAWLETRMPALNKRDLRLIDASRQRGLISTKLQVDFAPPKDELMLWLPDAVAGATTAARLGQTAWLDMMATIVRTIDISVR